jgi:hypothetical protein
LQSVTFIIPDRDRLYFGQKFSTEGRLNRSFQGQAIAQIEKQFLASNLQRDYRCIQLGMGEDDENHYSAWICGF